MREVQHRDSNARSRRATHRRIGAGRPGRDCVKHRISHPVFRCLWSQEKEIYVYHFHNFREVRRIRLAEETEKGDRSLAISSLFPANHEFQEYHRKFDESLEKQREDRSVAANVAKGTKEFIVNYDTNGDSKLDLDELGAYGCFFREVDVPTIRTFDRDGDGNLMRTSWSTSVWRSARLSCSANLFLDWIPGPSRPLDLARPSA